MLYNYALHLLKIELEKEKERKQFNEKYFADKGGLHAYAEFCSASDRVESLQEAIDKLEGKEDEDESEINT